MSVVKLGSIYFIIESRTTIDVHYSVSIASEEIRQIKFERIDYIEHFNFKRGEIHLSIHD